MIAHEMSKDGSMELDIAQDKDKLDIVIRVSIWCGMGWMVRSSGMVGYNRRNSVTQLWIAS